MAAAPVRPAPARWKHPATQPLHASREPVSCRAARQAAQARPDRAESEPAAWAPDWQEPAASKSDPAKSAAVPDRIAQALPAHRALHLIQKDKGSPGPV